MTVVPMAETEATEFEEVFTAYSRFVYRTAYAVTGRHEDAEDVVQTIFLRLAKRDISSSMLINPQRYLYRAAVNASLNVVRTRRRAAILQDAAGHAPVQSAHTSNVDDEELLRCLREEI